MRTVESLLHDARQVLHSAEMSRPDWTWAGIISARLVGGPNTRRSIGELGWRQWRVRFVEVDRGVRRTLTQHGKTLEPGITGVFLVRLVIHHRFGFQAEVFDVMPETVRRETEFDRTVSHINGVIDSRSDFRSTIAADEHPTGSRRDFWV